MDTNGTVRDLDSLDIALNKVKTAQGLFEEYTQEEVDRIFRAVAMCASDARLPLAEMAVNETKMGVLEDKTIKNHIASEFIYNKYKNEKTCGVIEIDDALGIQKIASPVGVIGAIIPATNPTSTTIFKILIALKSRNGIIISPHPRAKGCTIETARLLLEAAVKAGAPRDIISWVDEPSIDLTRTLMSRVDLILATGGSGLVKSAYSSGKPAIGVGAGNTPAIIDKSADIRLAVSSIIHSKVFDNGMICASEQAIIVDKKIYKSTREELVRRGAYILSTEERERLREHLFVNGSINAQLVGKSATEIAKMAKIVIGDGIKLLIAECNKVDCDDLFSHEKLCPVLTMYSADTFDNALEMADLLLKIGGLGHTASLYIDEIKEMEKISAFKEKTRACRALVNTPSSQGGVGDIYNFGLAPSFTLGCGSWGGNSICENVGVKQLLNIKTLAIRRENMLWLKIPKIYFKRGCFEGALEELREIIEGKKVFLVTDDFLFSNGYARAVTEKLSRMNALCSVFYDIEPDPTLESAKRGASQMQRFKPDTIMAFGGGSAMDAAKVMWLLYEHPDTDFSSISARFGDIKKRIYDFPKLTKAHFIAIPTTSGTGSEVTPFSVITDEKTGIKYPIADYELLPHYAIIDIDFHMSAPQALTSATGIDALTHALEAYVSVMANDFTNALSISAIKLIFESLESAYSNGTTDVRSREKMANGATMAGIAFANAFLGVCHSMAHKLGSFHHLPHGVANALLIEQVIRFNSSEAPTRMGTFSQYQYPMAKERYAEIAKAIGIRANNNDEYVDKLIEKIRSLKKSVGIKDSILEYGISENDFFSTLDEMTRLAFDDQCTASSPRYPLLEEIKAMYINAYYGKTESK